MPGPRGHFTPALVITCVRLLESIRCPTEGPSDIPLQWHNYTAHKELSGSTGGGAYWGWGANGGSREAKRSPPGLTAVIKKINTLICKRDTLTKHTHAYKAHTHSHTQYTCAHTCMDGCTHTDNLPHTHTSELKVKHSPTRKDGDLMNK